MPHIESKLHRAGPEDVQCGATYKNGQCPYAAKPGTDRCAMHGGNAQEQAVTAQSVRGYRLAQWHARVSEFADQDGIKSLRDEIGIMRMTLETILLKCKDEQELILYAPRIADMVTRIEKIVSSCHRLEQSSGMLLDRATALLLAGKIVEILGQHIGDPDVLDAIAAQIGEAIVSVGKEPNPDG